VTRSFEYCNKSSGYIKYRAIVDRLRNYCLIEIGYDNIKIDMCEQDFPRP
jgi:hypothetical protein